MNHYLSQRSFPSHHRTIAAGCFYLQTTFTGKCSFLIVVTALCWLILLYNYSSHMITIIIIIIILR